MIGVRPTGVSIISVLNWLGGAYALIGGVTSYFSDPLNATILIVIGLLSMIVGYGLWTLQQWAWIAGIILSLIGILGGVFFAAVGDFTGWIEVIKGLIVGGYLFTYNVKEAFGRV